MNELHDLRKTDSTEPQGLPTTEAELLLAVSRAAKALSRDNDWRKNMPEFLGELGVHTGASRVWLFRVTEQEADYYVTEFIHEWAAGPEWSNIADSRLQRQRVDIRDAATRALYEARCRGELLQHHRGRVTGRMRREFELQGIHSMLTIPVMVDGFWWGILGFDHCEGPRNYAPGYLAALETGAILLTNMILRERLHWEANHDHLTRLLNRRFFMRGVESELENGVSGCFVILDVDWFKAVNDRYGHMAGDHALWHLAKQLRDSVPDDGLCARMGGEEFAVWLPYTASRNAADCVALVDGFREGLAQMPVVWERQTILLTVSAGLTQYQATDTAETLFARADQALYRAKSRGRNQLIQS